MTSLWERYGTITQAELAENITRMSAPWNPPQPIEDLFLQLTRGGQFAADGSEPIALSQVLRIGYTLIANTGLFIEACREWRKIRDTDKIMAKFQELFTKAKQDRSSLLTTSSQAGYHAGTRLKRHSSNPQHALCASNRRSSSNGTRASYQRQFASNGSELFTEAEQDRSSLLTTSSQAGYHAGNATAVIATTPFAPAAAVPPPTEHALAMARVQATADATQAQMATLIATMKSQNLNQKNIKGTSYCWTHGHTTNSSHTSASCEKQADGHEVTATKTNRMGGSDHVYGH